MFKKICYSLLYVIIVVSQGNSQTWDGSSVSTYTMGKSSLGQTLMVPSNVFFNIKNNTSANVYDVGLGISNKLIFPTTGYFEFPSTTNAVYGIYNITTNTENKNAIGILSKVEGENGISGYFTTNGTNSIAGYFNPIGAGSIAGYFGGIVGIGTQTPNSLLHIYNDQGWITAMKIDHVVLNDYGNALKVNINRNLTRAVSVFNETDNEYKAIL